MYKRQLYTAVGILRFQDSIKEHKTPTVINNRQEYGLTEEEFFLDVYKRQAGIFATQDLNDFFALDDGKYGKGIINNCKTKIILNMEDEEAQRVKTLSLIHI